MLQRRETMFSPYVLGDSSERWLGQLQSQINVRASGTPNNSRPPPARNRVVIGNVGSKDWWGAKCEVYLFGHKF